MFGIHEKIIRKDLHTQLVNELIPCYGYKYLSILTDGAINPNPPSTALVPIAHYIILKNSNRFFPIYGEMRNISLGKNTEIRYTNDRPNIATGNLENGFGNIIFYLSNYKNDFVSLKENCGFQWEDSFQVLASANKYYHFGIERTGATHILAMPFIPDNFNKLVYLFKESSASTTAVFQFICKDDDIQTINMVTDTLTELLLPAKRFKIYLLAGLSDIDYDIMIKFLKA